MGEEQNKTKEESEVRVIDSNVRADITSFKEKGKRKLASHLYTYTQGARIHELSLQLGCCRDTTDQSARLGEAGQRLKMWESQ